VERAKIDWRAQFLLLSAIWGLSFMFIKVGDEALAQLQVALGRLLCGGATLLLVLAMRREALPRDPHVWGHLSVAALLVNALPFSLFAYGETHVTSVVAGMWNATTPLLTVLLAMAVLPDERPTRERGIGLGIGFAGVLVLLGIWHAPTGVALVGNLACLGAAACYALGFPYLRKYVSGRPESGVALSAGQVLCGAVALGIVTPLFTTRPSSLPVATAASVLALGALGTGLAYILNYGVIRAAGATVASTVTYVIPVFATAAGIAVLGERLSWNEPLGGLLVIMGLAVTQGRVRALAFRTA
jgi:drug/metabolite transporter (DMT)-like permease